MRVILAPDKFKGSLSAPEVAQHLAAGLRSTHEGLDIELMPVADGGEGTIDAVVAAGFTRVTATVQGPTGEAVEADFAVRGNVAVIEMASASGLAVLPDGRLAPLAASTFGTGQLVSAALDHGCTEIVLGVGGSASTDGGAGMLAALGVTFKNAAGRHLPPGGGALSTVTNIDVTGLDKRLGGVVLHPGQRRGQPAAGPGRRGSHLWPPEGRNARARGPVGERPGAVFPDHGQRRGHRSRGCPGHSGRRRGRRHRLCGVGRFERQAPFRH